MKFGVIDLGTNTFNILIVEHTAGKPMQLLLNKQSAVMLGSDGLDKGYISNKIFNRAFAVLSNFRRLLNEFKCEEFVAFGTSAIRSAKNSTEFISKVSSELNINIESISGDQEAEYIYLGVKRAVEFADENYLILDIGGGSNEFIIANKNLLLWKYSFPLGVARLLEKFQPSDPVSDEEIKNIKSYLEKELDLLREALIKYPVTKLVGSSGAFDSFVAIIAHEKSGMALPELVVTSLMSLNEFDTLYNMIVKTSHEDRLIIPGLDSIRVDTIVMASIFTHFTVEFSGANEIIQSAYSLKEGVAAQYFY
ncbi:MAG: hypothetical protein PF517_02065 [Salinivirgaceae bacterium]|jgi:exopolyphosphatase/guanosine-5'-triphosphate,3'-diphosphate pyrophosphatase|nr:hypothetical protein [Salinivirgaceae bacterium]